MCSVASIAVLDCTLNLHVDLLVLWPFAKVFSMKFRGVTSFGGTSEQLAEVSLQKLAPIHLSFLPRMFPVIQYIHPGSTDEKVICNNYWSNMKSYSCHPSEAHSINKCTTNDRSQKLPKEHKHEKISHINQSVKMRVWYLHHSIIATVTMLSS